MTRIYKVKFVSIKVGGWDLAFVEAINAQEAISKVKARFPGIAISGNPTIVFKK